MMHAPLRSRLVRPLRIGLWVAIGSVLLWLAPDLYPLLPQRVKDVAFALATGTPIKP